MSTVGSILAEMDHANEAREALLSWAETDAARELLAKIDGLELLSDRWCGEVPEAASALNEAAIEARCDLDELRRTAVLAMADAMSSDRDSDEWLLAWQDAEDEAPGLEWVIGQARRGHAGDEYLGRFV